LENPCEKVGTCKSIEILHISDLKKAKKEAKHDKAASKKRIESIPTALLWANAESERINGAVSTLKKRLANQVAKEQSLEKDSLGARESAPLQQKRHNLQNTMDEYQSNIRSCLQSQGQLKKRL
jgi:chromosome segregation ATPase